MLDALAFWVLLLVLFVPGSIAAYLFEYLCSRRSRRRYRFITMALIFDLVILGINLAGLYLFKHIPSMEVLATYFNCLSFTPKYMLLSIAVGIIVALFACLVKWVFRNCFRVNG